MNNEIILRGSKMSEKKDRKKGRLALEGVLKRKKRGKIRVAQPPNLQNPKEKRSGAPVKRTGRETALKRGKPKEPTTKVGKGKDNLFNLSSPRVFAPRGNTKGGREALTWKRCSKKNTECQRHRRARGFRTRGGEKNRPGKKKPSETERKRKLKINSIQAPIDTKNGFKWNKEGFLLGGVKHPDSEKGGNRNKAGNRWKPDKTVLWKLEQKMASVTTKSEGDKVREERLKT